MSNPPRWLPEREFPPYTYVPGQAPHPIRDPDGHMHGHEPDEPELIIDEWWRCEAYLWGIDLFNHGYYWEAHEAWEGLWHAAGRKGVMADFLKGLIKIAAAGVKAHEGAEVGCRRHARRAGELFESVSTLGNDSLMGLSLPELISMAKRIQDRGLPPTAAERTTPIVFPYTMSPTR